MSRGYQAGSYYYGLAQTLENAGLKPEASAAYAEAVRFWSAFQGGRPLLQKRVAAAAAGRDRCRS
jgi:hypothetical protein